MDKAAAHLTPALGVLAADNDDICWHAQVADGAMKTHRLLSLVVNLRLDNQKVDIAVGVGLSPSMGTEQNHLRLGGSSRRQTASRLCDQGFVNRVNVEIVVATSDCQRFRVAARPWLTSKRRPSGAPRGLLKPETRVQVAPGASMHLALETSPPRRAFKQSLGQANHFLITILVGLDAVEDGSAKQRPGMPVSWNPKDPVRSAVRSRGFAARAAFALLFDCIDVFTWEILEDPPIVQRDDDRTALRQAKDSKTRFEALAKLVGEKGGPAWALLNLGRAWRHRLVHSRAGATPDGDAIAALRKHKDDIEDAYAGLDIEQLQKSFPGEPHLKETTAMIRAGHQFVEATDRELLAALDPCVYAKQALASHLRPLELSARKVRVSNLWGQNDERRQRAVLNVLSAHGMTVSIEKRDAAAEIFIKEMLALKPREVLKALDCT